MNEKLIEKMQKFSKEVELTGDEEYERQLNSWGKQIVKSEVWEKYRNLPMSQEITQALVRTVKSINRKLIDDPHISTEKRAAYKADKDRCMWLIKTLSHNFQKDLKLIEMAIDNELAELGE